MIKNLLVLVLSLCALNAHAADPAAPSLSDSRGLANAAIAQSRAWVGGPVYRVESSTPAARAILLYSGPGFLLGVSASSATSATSSAFCLAMDSNTVSGVSLTSKGLAASPYVYALKDTGALPPEAIVGNWAPKSGVPVYMAAGLVGIKNDATTNCLYQFSALSVSAPGQ